MCQCSALHRLARSEPRDEHVVRTAVVWTGMTDVHPKDPVVDLLGPLGSGPLWGLASSDLNATLLAWPAGHSLVEHTTELDVLVIVLGGDGVVTIDRRAHTISAGSALLIEKGRARAIRAGAHGIRYLTVHTRRGPLQLEGAPTEP
jgi:quercetin dioxygenase-like cupin family protein